MKLMIEQELISVLGEVSGVPEIDDEVQIENVIFKIVKMHKNRIAQLKVTILEEKKDEEEEHHQMTSSFKKEIVG